MFLKILHLAILILLFSCSAKEEKPQQTPNFYQNSAPQPQYYYPPQNRPTYQMPYQPYSPYNPYGNTAGSRFYSNPYALPAGAPNYYDSDQYYVPPRYYNNDPQQNNPFYRETSAF